MPIAGPLASLLRPVLGCSGLLPTLSFPHCWCCNWFPGCESSNDKRCSFGWFRFFLNHLVLRSNEIFIACYKTKPRATAQWAVKYSSFFPCSGPWAAGALARKSSVLLMVSGFCWAFWTKGRGASPGSYLQSSAEMIPLGQGWCWWAELGMCVRCCDALSCPACRKDPSVGCAVCKGTVRHQCTETFSAWSEVFTCGSEGAPFSTIGCLSLGNILPQCPNLMDFSSLTLMDRALLAGLSICTDVNVLCCSLLLTDRFRNLQSRMALPSKSSVGYGSCSIV